ncbi:MAG TPA: response regulator transcription factor [Hyphomicrobiales bacterium]|nr:response regulator transcription factor [Hyphomicrobiales bacterium]
MEREPRLVNYKQLNHKILVVDNEPLVVEELVEFLVSQGFLCVDAVGAHDALIQFTANPDIVLVLSDFRMPEMTGIQLLEALRSTVGNERIFETIIFTGDADKGDVIDALRAGVADYFQKPLDLKLLVEGITRVLAKIERRQAESRIRTLSQSLKILSNSLNQICNDGTEAPLPNEARAPLLDDLTETLPGGHAAMTQHEKLSPRQNEVAQLIGRGLTNYQIACELGISENTVKIYVSQILRIYNLRNRTQLALFLDGSRGQAHVTQQRRVK